MGLLRIATIIAVGIAVLPSDRDQQQRLYDRAGATAEWVITFCDRNGPTCAKGAELWSQFVAKAEFGAKLAYDTLREQQAGKDPAAERSYSAASLERDSGTLTPQDKRPAWRGNKPHNKGSI
jgi:hypothetical protein